MSKMNVGSVSRALITKCQEQGVTLSNEELAQKVVELFKAQDVEVKTSGACIAWYKSDMRKKGQLLGKAQHKAIEIDMEEVEL
jgi:pyrimidine operon attenuation protein/uracil phosphoribosyltransferase